QGDQQYLLADVLGYIGDSGSADGQQNRPRYWAGLFGGRAIPPIFEQQRDHQFRRGRADAGEWIQGYLLQSNALLGVYGDYAFLLMMKSGKRMTKFETRMTNQMKN